MIQKNFFKIIFLSLLVVGCTATPPQQPDNICSIFKEKKSWYKAAIRTEKRWKLPPYVLMSFVFQESSYNAKAKPERDKLLGFIPWFRGSGHRRMGGCGCGYGFWGASHSTRRKQAEV